MKSGNVVQTKSYDFALKTIKIYKYLSQEKKEFILSKQLLRSGISIGANIEESIDGQSRADFFAKLTIAYKEARESKYWVRLLRDSDYLTIQQADDLLNDIEELLKIIGSIQKSVRNS